MTRLIHDIQCAIMRLDRSIAHALTLSVAQKTLHVSYIYPHHASLCNSFYLEGEGPQLFTRFALVSRRLHTHPTTCPTSFTRSLSVASCTRKSHRRRREVSFVACRASGDTTPPGSIGAKAEFGLDDDIIEVRLLVLPLAALGGPHIETCSPARMVLARQIERLTLALMGPYSLNI